MDKQKAKQLKLPKTNGGLPAIHANVKFSPTSDTLAFNWEIAENRHPCLQASRGSS